MSPGIRLTRSDSVRYTKDIVEVSADENGVIRVMAINAANGLTLD